MKHLIIKQVGPIKDVDIDLKSYNFIIGPQSCGKSTIAKIYSTCQWIEKEVSTTQDEHIIMNGESFVQLVENYHKMKCYFNRESEIEYETDSIHLKYRDGVFKVQLKPGYNYCREKICYIPAERNAVTLPELRGLELGNTSVRSYVFDWFNARDLYGQKNQSDVLNLGVKYFYDTTQKEEKDRIIHKNGETYDIPLSNASSGLQSVVPLIIMMQYYTGEYFSKFQHRTSFDENDRERLIRKNLIENFVLKPQFPDFSERDSRELIQEINRKLKNNDPQQQKILEEYQEILQRLLIPVRTSFIIEEPEQNIYPMTQLDLINEIVSLCMGERKHLFMITTHSPFIISYVNVLLKKKIAPDNINVWSVADGKLIDLKGFDKDSKTYVIDGFELSAPMMKVFDMYKAN